jgi:hypothetical protein
MTCVESDVVVVTHLFPPERASLVELLSSLAARQWQALTVCPGWSVKDVALHLLGDDIDLVVSMFWRRRSARWSEQGR